jgi:hypothetical protein
MEAYRGHFRTARLLMRQAIDSARSAGTLPNDRLNEARAEAEVGNVLEAIHHSSALKPVMRVRSYESRWAVGASLHRHGVVFRLLRNEGGREYSREISKCGCGVEARQPRPAGMGRFQSVRSAITESILVARRAGKNDAASATSSSVIDNAM